MKRCQTYRKGKETFVVLDQNVSDNSIMEVRIENLTKGGQHL